MADAPRPTRQAAPRLASYAEEYARFQVTVPDRYNPVLAIVERWAAEDPDATALISLDGKGELIARYSAAELALETRKAARALLGMGVAKGDRIIVMLPRHPAWFSAMLGAMRIGAVPIPTPTLVTSRDLAYRLETSGATAVITDSAGGTKLAELGGIVPAGRVVASIEEWRQWLEAAGDGEVPADPTAATDPLILFFTSGTVSYPKMAIHSQSYALGHIGTARFWHDLRPGDLHWTISDTGWAKAAWGCLFGQWHERATVVQVALDKPDADTILGIVAAHGITSLCAPPTLYRSLVQADFSRYDLSALRHCSSAGEPLNPEVIRAWSAGTGGLTVYDGYGQSETTALVANYRSLPVRPGSMGKPVPGFHVAIVDDDGREIPAGTSGHIAVRTEPRPAGLFLGYFRNEEANAEAFRNGWYYTGDRGERDADGYLWFEGRSDDVITSSAYRIGPFEVESALVEHPAVVEAGVVGKPDPDRTEIVTAFIILAAGYEGTAELARELQDHCKQVTAPYKYPREIHFVTELPKTISGKIRRTELRRRLRDGEVGQE